jgi:hypothetical protein
MISQPEIVLDGDTTQVLDARNGVPFSVAPDNAAARGGSYDISAVSKLRVCDCMGAYYVEVDPRFHEMFAATVPGARTDGFGMTHARRAAEPALELSADDGQPFEIRVDWLAEAPAGAETLPVVFGGAGTPEDLAAIDAGGKLVVLEVPAGMDYPEIEQVVGNVKAAGGKFAMLSFVGEATSMAMGGEDPAPLVLPTLYSVNGATAARFVAYAKNAGATASYVSRPLSTIRYELAYGVEGPVTTPQVRRPRTRDLAEVRTAYHDSVPTDLGVAASMELFYTPRACRVGTGAQGVLHAGHLAARLEFGLAGSVGRHAGVRGRAPQPDRLEQGGRGPVAAWTHPGVQRRGMAAVGVAQGRRVRHGAADVRRLGGPAAPVRPDGGCHRIDQPVPGRHAGEHDTGPDLGQRPGARRGRGLPAGRREHSRRRPELATVDDSRRGLDLPLVGGR